MRDMCADCEIVLTEFNGEDNYVHLLVSFPLKVALPRLGLPHSPQPKPRSCSWD